MTSGDSDLDFDIINFKFGEPGRLVALGVPGETEERGVSTLDSDFLGGTVVSVGGGVTVDIIFSMLVVFYCYYYYSFWQAVSSLSLGRSVVGTRPGSRYS